ncbi:MarR family winged helix-turn-helix transcriptional regulator [Actinokineospora cianjurensis]|uniref:DNA-binding MarR family transcriptional regulator n=1 Tax=Actinokineospora cianjurensis TaxID=585224 RepID=A0A421B239_9PSEU|nr:MarR family winged helix-turn-helix transcriptional regulator [Actinokineospora cianjurensis]RLK58412.1 DNA-binding MarR family transcriptional regulator [Actinokineospora cianjurensis]
MTTQSPVRAPDTTTTPTACGTDPGAGLDTALVAAVVDLQVGLRQFDEWYAAARGLHPIDLRAVIVVGGHHRTENRYPTPSLVAARLCLTTSSATSLIARLTATGLLQRVRDDRLVRVELTDTGCALLADHHVRLGGFLPRGGLSGPFAEWSAAVTAGIRGDHRPDTLAPTGPTTGRGDAGAGR